MSNVYFPNQHTPAEWLNMAAECSARNARRDAEQMELSDCSLSMWADNVMSSVYRLCADLAENGGMSDFWALADLEGNLVNAVECHTRFGTRWALTNEAGKFTGEFLAWCPARASTLAKKGYQEVLVTRPAGVVLQGDRVNVRPVVIQLKERAA